MSLRFPTLTLLWVVALATTAADAQAAPTADGVTLRWKIPSKAAWPPVPAATAVVFKTGNTLTAHDLKDGKTTWKAKFRKLAKGPSVLASGPGMIYVLGRRGVILLSLAGKVSHTYKLKGATSVLHKGDSVYVAARSNVLRLDNLGKKELGTAAVKGAKILGASGRYAAIFSRQKQKKGSRLSPNLLQVVDLATGKGIYQFRLLPDGSHKVAHMDARKLAFVDYTRVDSRGNNRRKLYFTVVDYQNNKKLRDLSLSRLYASDPSDTIWVTLGAQDNIFLATHGRSGQEANVAGFDLNQRKSLWERLGTQPNLGLALFQGLLWSAIRDDKGATKLVGLDPRTGKAVQRLVLDGNAVYPPVEVAGRLFVRTSKSVYCFGGTPQNLLLPGVNKAPSPSTPPPTRPAPVTALPAAESPDEPAAVPLTTEATPLTTEATPLTTEATPSLANIEQPPPLPGETGVTKPGVRPGFRTHMDRQLGFSMQVPETWFLDQARQRRLGGPRAVIPFARVKRLPGQRFFLGTVQVLTWEAAGRDASGLWRSIFVQRHKLNPEIKVKRVFQIKNVGGTGLPGVVARYSFTGPGGQPVILRSLCVVSNGVAYELRAWAGPMHPARTWREVEEIFSSFRVFIP